MGEININPQERTLQESPWQGKAESRASEIPSAGPENLRPGPANPRVGLAILRAGPKRKTGDPERMTGKPKRVNEMEDAAF